MDTKVISTGFRYASLPESYVRPESDRPNLSEVKDCDDVPIIDLGCEDRASVIQQVGNACQHYGFFQVINHGVSTEAVEKMLEVAFEFFRLPVEEKMKLYSDDPSKTMRLSTSFNVKKETVHNWRDYLRLHCYPLDQYVPEWPSNPSSFKDIVRNYCEQVRELGFRLQELIAESLGLEKDHIKAVLGEQGQHMAVNYYPPCPQPDLTYGLPKHTDPNALTILLQDLHVSGLQVLKDGKWVAIKPHPKAFVINLGDQLQALSNGRYKSVWHRAIVNADKPRMSVASFLCPSDEALISPPVKLTEDGAGAVYKSFTYAEYYKKFWSRNLDQEHCLELFKVACRDYPHSRHLCLNNPFEKTPHERHCELCYCFVCDKVAPCKKWYGDTGHCHAIDNFCWRDRREKERNGQTPLPAESGSCQGIRQTPSPAESLFYKGFRRPIISWVELLRD